MDDRELYRQILGIAAPWEVSGVKVDGAGKDVTVTLSYGGGAEAPCPECGTLCRVYDERERRWRHLDTCQYRTIICAPVPRVRCDVHKVRQVRVPWAEEGSRFTALFEALVINWLTESSISAVAEQMGLNWDAVDGIIERAVRRGMARRAEESPRVLGLDELSAGRGHNYVTLVNDCATGTVLAVLDDREEETVRKHLQSLSPSVLEGIERVAMDMWKPYISAISAVIPQGNEKICYDRFHVAKKLNEAVDQVRRQEHKRLSARGDDSLKGTKYIWLTGSESLSDDRQERLDGIINSAKLTARAYRWKEWARQLWSFSSIDEAKAAWKKWYHSAYRSSLAPIRKVAKTVMNHLDGIVRAAVYRVTNASSESINAKVRVVTRAARGFRSKERLKRAILFHCGGLDLHPTLPQGA